MSFTFIHKLIYISMLLSCSRYFRRTDCFVVVKTPQRVVPHFTFILLLFRRNLQSSLFYAWNLETFMIGKTTLANVTAEVLHSKYIHFNFCIVFLTSFSRLLFLINFRSVFLKTHTHTQANENTPCAHWCSILFCFRKFLLSVFVWPFFVWVWKV